MNRTQALTKLKKLVGPKLEVRVNEDALVGEEREAMSTQFRAARDERNALNAAMSKRREELLAADADYQALRAKYVAADKLYETGKGHVFHHRIEVYTRDGIGLTYVATADNWAEAVEKVTAKVQPQAETV